MGFRIKNFVYSGGNPQGLHSYKNAVYLYLCSCVWFVDVIIICSLQCASRLIVNAIKRENTNE